MNTIILCMGLLVLSAWKG